MRIVRALAFAVAAMVAGTAHAQDSVPTPTAQPMAPPAAPEFRGPDERPGDFDRLQDDVSRRTAGPTRSLDPVPASPEDVSAGRDVRDSRGRLLGTVQSVAMGYAVVAGADGKVEVDLASFGKNNKGLLINMPKAKFDAIVAGGKPAQQ